MTSGIVSFLAAAVASLTVYLVLPIQADDPFRGTLIVLPLVAAALGQITRWTRFNGDGQRLQQSIWPEWAAIVLLVGLALGRNHLGLRYADPLASGLIAAGFVLVLALRVARIVRALRPLLDAPAAQRPSAVFFLLPLTVYLAILPWSNAQRPPDGDESYYLLVAHSIAHDFDVDLANNYEAGDSLAIVGRRIGPQPGDPVGSGGEQYSRHNALLPLVLAPAYRVGGTIGALGVMAMLSAALAWSFLKLARRFWADRPAATLVAYAIVAFTAPLLLYSHQAWIEVPAALLLTLALDGLLQLHEGSRHHSGVRRWLRIVIPLACLPLLKLRFIVLVAGVFLLGGFILRRRRKLLLLGVSLLALLSTVLLAFNQMRFGTALKTRGWEVLRLHETPPMQFVKGSLGLFFDCGFGLFAFAPVWGLLLVSVWIVASDKRRTLLLHTALVLGPYLLFVVSAPGWFGAWSPPFRYAMVGLPLLGVLLVPALETKRGGHSVLLGALGLLTLSLTLLWVVVPGWTYNLPTGTSHLLDHLSRLTGSDVGRLFPSYVRPRLASWIWPAIAMLGAMAGWRLRRPAFRRGLAMGGPALLAAVAVFLLAARLAPTTIVELEDAQVARSGGHLFPQQWTLARENYRGGWRVHSGDGLRAPVTPGGSSLRVVAELSTECRQSTDMALRLVAADRELLTTTIPCRIGWQSADLGTALWPTGSRELTVELVSVEGETAIVDRLRIDWE